MSKQPKKPREWKREANTQHIQRDRGVEKNRRLRNHQNNHVSSTKTKAEKEHCNRNDGEKWTGHLCAKRNEAKIKNNNSSNGSRNRNEREKIAPH